MNRTLIESGPIRLSIVIPCYNEEEGLETTAAKVLGVLDALQSNGTISERSQIYFIDDGSKDGTWKLIRRLAATDPQIVGIKLSRNVGHQNALIAGLFTAPGDALISMDADLQDDVSVIERMIKEFLSGNDIVYGVRSERTTDTVFKRWTAEGFYWMMRMFGVDIIRNHADCRLMSRRAIDGLQQFREVNLFLRGLVRLVGLPNSIVYYERRSRVAGQSKYPLRRMLAFALDGITSFSAVPLRLISWIGFSVFLLTIVLSGWVLYVKLFLSGVVPGWASTVLPLYFIGGVQIMCIGIIGEYLAKIYLESKARPRFLVEDTTSNDSVGKPCAKSSGLLNGPNSPEVRLEI